jgi:hypothetical protein
VGRSTDSVAPSRHGMYDTRTHVCWNTEHRLLGTGTGRHRHRAQSTDKRVGWYSVYFKLKRGKGRDRACGLVWKGSGAVVGCATNLFRQLRLSVPSVPYMRAMGSTHGPRAVGAVLLKVIGIELWYRVEGWVGLKS